MENTTRSVWFWTFWHWSKEGSRAGLLAGDPLFEIRNNWEQWFRDEASEEDLLAIVEISRTRAGQSKFVTWLVRHWAEDGEAFGNRLVPRFVLGQLASSRPFSDWRALERYRVAYGATGVSAVVLAEDSAGEASDVRSIEALILPSADISSAREVIAEGFKADMGELRAPRQSASTVLGGRAGWTLLALWILIGERPYAEWFQRTLTFGWLFVAGLICWLLVGPDPGGQLAFYCGLLLTLWSTLGVISLTTVIMQGIYLRREGKAWDHQLRNSQVRLRMHDGLTIKGGSAGLAFALNVILATYRSSPQIASRSWIWRRIFRSLDDEGGRCAATGVITSEGWVRAVMLPPKLRACFRQPIVKHLLAPRQKEAASRMIDRFRLTFSSVGSAGSRHPSTVSSPRVGLAAESSALRVYRCQHIALALLSIARLGSRCQVALNVLALVLSVVVLAALPSMRSSLFPAPPPVAMPPASSSPYYLWVSLDTDHPEQFQVVLESRFWINRRVRVLDYLEQGNSRRAEIRLLRLAHGLTTDPEDGVVWIERRCTFLSREYAPGERVGLYSFFYLNHLGRE